MNVRGERILIFGDSLSHHGPDAGPEIWDVDQGSARASGQPGDLLASMLVEQGAKAARVNARVGRSAHNFFGRENHQALFASDQAFLPTKVLIILGTNDIGLNMQADENAMRKIRDFYKGLGAEVWGVGPFMYVSDSLNKQAIPVVHMMERVFGSKFIDPRPITAMVGRGGDGVHFGAESARQTALGLQQLVLSSSSGKGTWMMLGLGVLAAIGGSIAYSWWKTGKAPAMLSGSLGESCNPNMSPEAFKRCTKRQKRAQLGGRSGEEDPLAKRQRIGREITELIKDPDPSVMEVAQDLALQNGIKLSELSRGATDNRGTFWLDDDDDIFKRAHVSWRVDRLDDKHPKECRLSYHVLVNGARIGGNEPQRDHVRFEEDFAGSDAACRRAATAQAWAIAKETKRQAAQGFIITTPDIFHVIDQNNSQPEELFGLGARQPIKHGGDPSAARFQERMNPDWAYIDGDEEFKDKRREFRRLINDEGPEVLDVAEDFAEENDIPISQLTTLNHDHADAGVVKIYPAKGAYDAYQVWWDVHEDPKNPGQWEPELNLGWGTRRETIASVPHIRNGEWTKPLIPFGTADTVEEARKIAALNAWHASKLLRELPRSASIDDAKALLKEFEQSHPQDKRFQAAHRTLNKRELFGQSSALQSRGMGSSEGYRVAYTLVTRRDGEIVPVRKIVEAPRALTLPEAEAWRRKWHRGGNTAWVETMAGQLVPVKGAKRAGRFVDDARPGDVHATLTAD